MKSGSIFLVSCVKTKSKGPCEAADLYTSQWFSGARRLVERSGFRWFILSAHYGLLAPTARVDSYERTLNTMRQPDRKAWADRVLRDLRPQLVGIEQVIFLAGVRYREYLAPGLSASGLKIDVPMQGLKFGPQISWMKAHAEDYTTS